MNFVVVMLGSALLDFGVDCVFDKFASGFASSREGFLALVVRCSSSWASLGEGAVDFWVAVSTALVDDLVIRFLNSGIELASDISLRFGGMFAMLIESAIFFRTLLGSRKSMRSSFC